MLRLRQMAVEVLPQGPVVKADAFAAVLTVQELVAHAEEEARRIKEEARAAYEAEKARGYREGLEQGKAEMTERVVATLGQSNLYFSKVEETLVDVVMKALRRIIGEFDDRERVVRIVRKALELLRNQSQVRLKVSPAQTGWLQAQLDTILASFPRIQFLDIQPEARLPADGCVLETELAVIDASVETQLRAIEKALIQAIK